MLIMISNTQPGQFSVARSVMDSRNYHSSQRHPASLQSGHYGRSPPFLPWILRVDSLNPRYCFDRCSQFSSFSFRLNSWETGPIHSCSLSAYDLSHVTIRLPGSGTGTSSCPDLTSVVHVPIITRGVFDEIRSTVQYEPLGIYRLPCRNEIDQRNERGVNPLQEGTRLPERPEVPSSAAE